MLSPFPQDRKGHPQFSTLDRERARKEPEASRADVALVAESVCVDRDVLISDGAQDISSVLSAPVVPRW